MTLVVLSLTDAEDDTRRIELILAETRRGVSHVELALTLRSVDGQRILVGDARAQRLRQTDAQRTIVHVGSVEHKLAVADEYLVDMRQTVETVVNTFNGNHSLTSTKDGQCLVFQTVSGHIDLWQLANLRQHGVISVNCLTLYRRHLQLGVERCEERRHEVVKAVEYRQRNDQRHRGYDNADDGDGTDDVDGIG